MGVNRQENLVSNVKNLVSKVILRIMFELEFDINEFMRLCFDVQNSFCVSEILFSLKNKQQFIKNGLSHAKGRSVIFVIQAIDSEKKSKQHIFIQTDRSIHTDKFIHT